MKLIRTEVYRKLNDNFNISLITNIDNNVYIYIKHKVKRATNTKFALAFATKK